MKAIILAAGEGKRLQPYTLDRPKCLVELQGVSLLERQIAVLRSRGVNEIVIIGGYRSENLEGMAKCIYQNPRYFETNMVWTLFCAEDELYGDLIVAYGDIVYSGNILDDLLKHPAEISIVIDMNWESYWKARSDDPLNDLETLRVDEYGNIIEIGQKPKSLAEIQGQYIGLMKFTTTGIMKLKNSFNEIRKNKKAFNGSPEKMYMTDLLQNMIDKGYKLSASKITDSWVEIDTVADFEAEITISRLLDIERSLKI